MTRRLFVVIAVFQLCGVAPARPADPLLRLPVACQPGRTCFVQHYVDRDPGPGVLDYACGNATYDGHDGTDLRVPTLAAMTRGVAVLAAASGTVLGVRDGQADVADRPGNDPSVRGIECGNGVVIDHGGGWQTQYCHMRSGSVQVRRGDTVTAGQAIGLVGQSGRAQFPHLHFTVRRDGRPVDPFAADIAPESCGSGHALWEPAVAAALAYAPRIVLNGGFTALVPTMETIESGEAEASPALPGAAVLSFYVRSIRLQAGDEQDIQVTAPDGSVVVQSRVPALERGKDQSFVFVGRRRPPQGFPSGTYAGTYTVRRGGQELLSFAAKVQM